MAAQRWANYQTTSAGSNAQFALTLFILIDYPLHIDTQYGNINFVF